MTCVVRTIVPIVLAAGLFVLAHRDANACAVCECGDPTLTTMGAGKPFEGRFRLSAELRHRSDVIGAAGIDQIRLNEQRLTFGASYAFRDWLVVSGTVPVLKLAVEHVNLAREDVRHIGDAEVRAKAFVWRDRAWSPRHLVAVHGGVKLPTGPNSGRDVAADFRLEALPGTGSFDPMAGVSYAFFRDPWSAYASTTLVVPLEGYEETRGGLSLRTTVAGQYQLNPKLAFRVAFDSRLDGKTREGHDMEQDTGGFIGFASPEVTYRPAEDLLLNTYVRVPLINALNGRHDEGIIVGFGITNDF